MRARMTPFACGIKVEQPSVVSDPPSWKQTRPVGERDSEVGRTLPTRATGEVEVVGSGRATSRT